MVAALALLLHAWTACPTTAPPPRLVAGPVAIGSHKAMYRWAPGVREIRIDLRRIPRRQLAAVIAHEARHACAHVTTGDASLGEHVYR